MLVLQLPSGYSQNGGEPVVRATSGQIANNAAGVNPSEPGTSSGSKPGGLVTGTGGRTISGSSDNTGQVNVKAFGAVGDLNFMELPEKTFDLVAAQTSLHHILFLERVADQVWRSLKNDGYLWVHDFIGETQWQYDPKRLFITNQLLEILPEKFRENRINNRLTTEIKRPEPGTLGFPFESIRSSEIVPVFQRWFTIEWKLEFDAFLRFLVPSGTCAAYLENEDTRALLEVLLILDHLCIEERIVQPTGGQYLMRPRPVNEIPAKAWRAGEESGAKIPKSSVAAHRHIIT